MTDRESSSKLPFLDPRSKAGLGQIAGFLLLIAGSIATRSGYDARALFLVGGAVLVIASLARLFPARGVTSVQAD
jgi:hypothetical protein